MEAPWQRGTFELRDLIASTEIDAFDWVLASGLFQFRPRHYLAAAVTIMLQICRQAVAFNFLTKTDGTRDEYAHDPTEVARICRGIAPRVVLRTDYLPNDATVYLYK
jgi:hypothetical protein